MSKISKPAEQRGFLFSLPNEPIVTSEHVTRKRAEAEASRKSALKERIAAEVSRRPIALSLNDKHKGKR